jgi:hypothetical protein
MPKEHPYIKVNPAHASTGHYNNSWLKNFVYDRHLLLQNSNTTI